MFRGNSGNHGETVQRASPIPFAGRNPFACRLAVLPNHDDVNLRAVSPVLAVADVWKIRDRYEVGVYNLPKRLDEEVACLQLEKIAAKLTTFSKKQADYIGADVAGAYKPGNYRY